MRLWSLSLGEGDDFHSAQSVRGMFCDPQEHPVIAAEDVAFAKQLGELLPGMLERRDGLVHLSRETQQQVRKSLACSGQCNQPDKSTA